MMKVDLPSLPRFGSLAITKNPDENRATVSYQYDDKPTLEINGQVITEDQYALRYGTLDIPTKVYAFDLARSAEWAKSVLVEDTYQRVSRANAPEDVKAFFDQAVSQQTFNRSVAITSKPIEINHGNVTFEIDADRWM